MGQTFSVFLLFFSVFCHLSNNLTSEPSSHDASGEVFPGGALASSVWNPHSSCFIQVYPRRGALPPPASSGMRKGISNSMPSSDSLRPCWTGEHSSALQGQSACHAPWTTYDTPRGAPSHPFYFTITSKSEGAPEMTGGLLTEPSYGPPKC